MPYISAVSRKVMINTGQPNNAGELNYLFTMIIDDYLVRNGLKYQNINDVIGALEGAKLELYRRVAAPYEDEKIKQNGDVYNVLHD